MRLKKQLRKAFDAVKPDVLHRILEDCPAGKPQSPALTPLPTMPKHHRLREWAATAAALVLLIGVATGGWLILRDLHNGGTGISPSQTDPDPTEPSAVTPTAPLEVPDGIRREILYMLGLSGANLTITPEVPVEGFSSYTVKCDGFRYAFTYNAQSLLLKITLLETNPESFLPPLVAKQLLGQELADAAGDGVVPSILSSGEMLLHMDALFYQYRIVNHPTTSASQTVYLHAVTGKLFYALPDGNIPASVRTEILSMLGIEGAESEIVPSLQGEYYAYAIQNEGFTYSFTFDSVEKFVAVDIVEATGESILPPLIAKQLLQQYLLAMVDTEPADPLLGPSVVTEGELLTLDVGTFYRFGVSLHPAMSFMPSYYVDATNGQIYDTLPEFPVPPDVMPFDMVYARDQALLAVHLSMDEVYYLHGEFPANEDGAYYIRWIIKSEKSTNIINQQKDYTVLDIISNDPVEGGDFADVPSDWYPWHKARTIALEEVGVDLHDLTALNCVYSDKDAWYIITFTAKDVAFSYILSAKDGSIIDGGPTGDSGQYVGSEYALDLVTRQSELPQALRNAILSGEAGVNCTLQLNGPDSVYSVELLWKDDDYAYHCLAQVHAVSGELLNFRVEEMPLPTVTPPESLTVENVAEHVIVNLFGFTMEESHVLGIEVLNDRYVVSFFAAGCRYDVTVDAASGERIDHTAEDQYDALEEFNRIFGDQTSYYNWALTDLYQDATELDLHALFVGANISGYGMPDVDWYDNWYESLSEHDQNLDHKFIPKALMEDVLATYFGVKLSSLSESCFAGLKEIPLVPSWYSCIDYVTYTDEFQAVGYEELENGNLALYYTSEYGGLRVVTLRLSRNNQVPWQILSNKKHIHDVVYETVNH